MDLMESRASRPSEGLEGAATSVAVRRNVDGSIATLRRGLIDPDHTIANRLDSFSTHFLDKAVAVSVGEELARAREASGMSGETCARRPGFAPGDPLDRGPRTSKPVAAAV